MITLHMTEAELLNAACHNDMQSGLRASAGAEMLMHPGCWPAYRDAAHTASKDPAIMAALDRAILWCDVASPALTRLSPLELYHAAELGDRPYNLD